MKKSKPRRLVWILYQIKMGVNVELKGVDENAFESILKTNFDSLSGYSLNFSTINMPCPLCLRSIK
jgi:hypothetical protein